MFFLCLVANGAGEVAALRTVNRFHVIRAVSGTEVIELERFAHVGTAGGHRCTVLRCCYDMVLTELLRMVMLIFLCRVIV